MKKYSKELATPGFVKVLDKDKKECFVNPEELVIGEQTLGSLLKNIQENQKVILDSNKKLQDDNKRLEESDLVQQKLVNELSKKIEETTMFVEEG